MTDEIIIITPEIAPGAGGLADHTRLVVEQWHGRFPVRFLVPPRALTPAAEVMGADADSLLRKLPQRGGKVLLQYSAYGFDRWGYPRWLLRALTKWRQRSGGRLVLLLHETWAFWPWWNKNYPVQQLHRRDLGRLLHVADAVFTTTEKQAGQLRSLCAACSPGVLPVGANVRPSGALPSAASREPGLAVLFGRQPSRVRTLRAMRTELGQLAASGRITRILTIGGGAPAEAEERALLAALPLRDGFEQRGAQSEEATSQALAHGSLAFTELDEHNVPKSSAFMIYAAHGLNIISPWANPAQPPPLCWTVSPNELKGGVEPAVLAQRAAALRQWQEEVAAWPVIARHLAAALAGEAEPARA